MQTVIRDNNISMQAFLCMVYLNGGQNMESTHTVEHPTLRLKLCAPLEYSNAPELTPFSCPFPQDEAAPELLFCFEIDREQSSRIDPQVDGFLGELVFSGKGDGKKGDVSLPVGLYLFFQERKVLGREECVGLAIEQQKDGLWERLRLENLLYIRYLFEDGSPVTQLFRTVS